MHAVVLSPHRDDAAFSCGLFALSVLRCGGSLTVVNVCTRSDYAPYLECAGKDRALQVSEARALEDRCFYRELARLSGADASTIRGVDLDWLDAPLRLAIPTEAVLTRGGPEPAEVRALADRLLAWRDADVVLAPLALGGHLDHRLVREAAAMVLPQTLGWYEDLPYAARMPQGERAAAVSALLDCRGWSPRSVEPPGTKRDLAMCYPSQIAPGVADEMETYGLQQEGRERFYLRATALRSLQHLEERCR